MTEDDQPEESAPVEGALRSLDRVFSDRLKMQRRVLLSNFDYTFEICMNILRQHPGCLDVRKFFIRLKLLSVRLYESLQVSRQINFTPLL